jgi:putative nucleotidyltransferase with HDIG domain
MKRILFVDDEQMMLDALRARLRKQRQQWDMVFAPGGQAALAELERGRFDVVVSDMRMPGIDGVTLLHRVKDQYPATARIILSGHAEREAVVNVLRVAHQFLSKPCDLDVLRTVIERATGLQALLEDDKVRSVIGSLDRLPSVPRTYWDLTQAAARSNVRVDELARIVEQDVAMSVKVLQLVNSGYFGLAHRQTSVQQAVTYLGTELLKAFTLTAHVFGSAGACAVKGFSLDVQQRHSLLVARLAKRLLGDRKSAAEAFTAALVHDIGKIVLAMGITERFEEVLRSTRETGRLAHLVEKELLGVTHAEVGAYLLGLWGLPLDIVEAVAYHHHPELVAPTDALVAVHVANALSYPPDGPTFDPSAGGRLNVAFVESAGFGSELPRWRSLAEDELRAAKHES